MGGLGLRSRQRAQCLVGIFYTEGTSRFAVVQKRNRLIMGKVHAFSRLSRASGVRIKPGDLKEKLSEIFTRLGQPQRANTGMRLKNRGFLKWVRFMLLWLAACDFLILFVKGGNNMKRTVLALALAAVAAPAGAALQIAFNINAVPFNCVDNALCDTNPAVGILQINDLNLGGVSVNGTSQFQTIGTTNFLNTASFQIINTNGVAVPIQFAVGGTNFLGPVGSFAASGSGTWQLADTSTLTQTWFADAANAQGADNPNDTPGIQLATFADVAVGPADSYSFSASGPFVAGGLHSMTMGASGTLAPLGTLVGRSQTMLTTPVPEPATLLLVGLGLVGVGAGLARRRTTK